MGWAIKRQPNTASSLADNDLIRVHDTSANGEKQCTIQTLIDHIAVLSETAPQWTLTNTTAEDTEGGRESQIIFKGTQSGSEETTLALIQASHDGTDDDQKGDLSFYTNDGTDNDTPTERLRIDSAGLATFAGAVAVGTGLTVTTGNITATAGKVSANSATGGVLTRVDVSDYTAAGTPTQAEMVAAFGAAASSAGQICIMDDNDSGADATVCVSNGTSWFYIGSTVGA